MNLSINTNNSPNNNTEKRSPGPELSALASSMANSSANSLSGLTAFPGSNTNSTVNNNTAMSSSMIGANNSTSTRSNNLFSNSNHNNSNLNATSTTTPSSSSPSVSPTAATATTTVSNKKKTKNVSDAGQKPPFANSDNKLPNKHLNNDDDGSNFDCALTHSCDVTNAHDNHDDDDNVEENFISHRRLQQNSHVDPYFSQLQHELTFHTPLVNSDVRFLPYPLAIIQHMQDEADDSPARNFQITILAQGSSSSLSATVSAATTTTATYCGSSVNQPSHNSNTQQNNSNSNVADVDASVHDAASHHSGSISSSSSPPNSNGNNNNNSNNGSNCNNQSSDGTTKSNSSPGPGGDSSGSGSVCSRASLTAVPSNVTNTFRAEIMAHPTMIIVESLQHHHNNNNLSNNGSSDNGSNSADGATAGLDRGSSHGSSSPAKSFDQGTGNQVHGTTSSDDDHHQHNAKNNNDSNNNDSIPADAPRRKIFSLVVVASTTPANSVVVSEASSNIPQINDDNHSNTNHLESAPLRCADLLKNNNLDGNDRYYLEPQASNSNNNNDDHNTIVTGDQGTMLAAVAARASLLGVNNNNIHRASSINAPLFAATSSAGNMEHFTIRAGISKMPSSTTTANHNKNGNSQSKAAIAAGLDSSPDSLLAHQCQLLKQYRFPFDVKPQYEPSELTRIFIGQLPYRICISRLVWIFATVAQVPLFSAERITRAIEKHKVGVLKKVRQLQSAARQKREAMVAGAKTRGETLSEEVINAREHLQTLTFARQPTGAVHALVPTVHATRAVALLHHRVLIDDSGIWYAEDGAQKVLLKEHAAEVKRQVSHENETNRKAQTLQEGTENNNLHGRGIASNHDGDGDEKSKPSKKTRRAKKSQTNADAVVETNDNSHSSQETDRDKSSSTRAATHSSSSSSPSVLLQTNQQLVSVTEDHRRQLLRERMKSIPQGTMVVQLATSDAASRTDPFYVSDFPTFERFDRQVEIWFNPASQNQQTPEDCDDDEETDEDIRRQLGGQQENKNNNNNNRRQRQNNKNGRRGGKK